MALSLVLSTAPNLPKPYPVAVPLWNRPNIWEPTIIGSCIFDPHPLRGSFWGDDTAIHVQSMLRKAKQCFSTAEGSTESLGPSWSSVVAVRLVGIWPHSRQQQHTIIKYTCNIEQPLTIRVPTYRSRCFFPVN